MHAGTLPVNAQNALAKLGKSNIFTESYLAGGSALALHLGHRISVDLDFYTQKKILAKDLPVQLARIGKFTVSLLEPPHTILGEFEGTKLSLFRYDYPMIGKFSIFKNIKIAGVEDIAAMKLSAISGRATKRDYIDLYFITQKFTVETMIDLYVKKFGDTGNNLYVIIKALGFFEDAKEDNMPAMIKPVKWAEVQDFFAKESLRLAKKYL